MNISPFGIIKIFYFSGYAIAKIFAITLPQSPPWTKNRLCPNLSINFTNTRAVAITSKPDNEN